MSSLDIFLKRKLWILLDFPETLVIKILTFWVHFVANIGKTVFEIIRRNVWSYMRVFIFYQVRVVLFPTTLFGVISADCINIIEVDILSLLDNTRYFIL